MARTPRLTARFLTQRQVLRIQAESPESLAIAKAIVALCEAEELPEPNHRAWLELDSDDKRGVALLADVLRVVVFEGRKVRRRLWLCYRSAGPLLRIEAIYDHPPPYDGDERAP